MPALVLPLATGRLWRARRSVTTGALHRFDRRFAGAPIGSTLRTGGAVGDPVIAFRVSDGYATAISVSAADSFAKPEGLGFPEAALDVLIGEHPGGKLALVR